MNKQRWLRGSVLAVGAFGLVAVSAHAFTRQHQPEPTVVTPAPAPKRAQVNAQLQRYRVEISAVTEQAGDRLNQNITGQLSIEHAQTPQGPAELWRLITVTVSASKNAGPVSERQPEPALCLVRRSGMGAPTELLFAAGSGAEQRRWLEFLIALARRPTSSPSEPWDVQERDGTGPYTATYSHLTDGTLVRTKLSYAAEATRGTGLKVDSSEAKLVFANDSLISVNAHERLSFRGGALVVDSTTKLAPDGAATDQSVDLAEIESLTHTFVFGQASRESASEQDAALAQGLTPQAGVAAVLQSTSPTERRGAEKRLAALARLDNAVLPSIAAAFAQNGLDPEPAVALLSAASQSGKLAAVDLIDAVARNPRQSEEVQREAVAALVEPRLPLRAACDKLLAHLSGPQRMTAALQLGVLAHLVAATEPATASTATERLWSEYKSATNLGERGLMISALGNAGDPRLLDELAGLHALETPLRARLISSMRRIPGAKAEHAVSAALHDSEPAVRQSALDVCGEWFDSRPCDGLEAVPLHDSNALTREGALRVLALRAMDGPTRARALKIVLRVASADSSARVRTVATQIAAELKAPHRADPTSSLFEQLSLSNPGKTP